MTKTLIYVILVVSLKVERVMIKKIVELIFLSLLSVGILNARDIEERSVGAVANWKESFDITDKKAGKYNIQVTVEDSGGNRQIAGPYNVFIDPVSDLPVTVITNPLSDMRVPGNLNILGTCIDDDGIDHVSIVFDGDTEHPRQAAGREFWSYYLSTTELSEGKHSIAVTGYDINGLAGKTTSVEWNLDRQQPVTAVATMQMGTLVSGKVDLSGSVNDGNGIKSLSYSFDGTVFSALKLRKTVNKKTGCVSSLFELPVDTKKFSDGPRVLWFRAEDLQGTYGLYSFLFFVDNTVPSIDIVSPREDSVQNGKFTIAGSAKDTIGISLLSWKFGNQSGNFTLIPGNPYWCRTFDTTNLKSRSVKFSVSAVDKAGNRIEKERVIRLDQNLDKPVVTLNEPAENQLLTTADLFIRGTASDDDGVAAIQYRLDNGETKTLRTQGVFYAPLDVTEPLPYGKHTITVAAVDINGVVGNPVTVGCTAPGPSPVFSPAVIRTGRTTELAVYGFRVNSEKGSSYETSVSSECGITSVRTQLTWGNSGHIENTREFKTPVHSVPVSVPLSDAPWGLVKVHSTARDMYGAVTEDSTILNIADLTRVYGSSPAVILTDSTIEPDGHIYSGNSQFFPSGYFIGGNAVKAELVPETPFASVKLDGNSFQLVQSSEEGMSDPVVVRITTDQGLSFDSRKIIFSSELKPASGYFAAVDGKQYESGMRIVLPRESESFLTVQIDRTIPLTAARYTIAGEDFEQSGRASLSSKEGKSVYRTAQIPLKNLPAGIVSVSLSVNSGKETTAEIKGTLSIVRKKDPALIDDRRAVYWQPSGKFQYDTVAGSYTLGKGQVVTGYANMELPLSVRLQKPTAGLSVSSDGHTIVVTALADGIYRNVIVLVTDAQGVEYQTTPVSITRDTQSPTLVMAEPVSSQWVRDNVSLKGTASDANRIVSVSYSLDCGKDWIPCSLTVADRNRTGLTWNSDIALASFADGLIPVDVKAVDGAGKETVLHTALQKDTTPPQAQVILPVAGNTVNGETRVLIFVKDAGSLAKTEFITPLPDKTDDPKSTVPVLQKELPADSDVSTLVGTADQPLSTDMAFKFTDSSGNSVTLNSWLFHIDTQSDLPHAEIQLPAENEVVTRDFSISGIVSDDDGPSTIWYKIDDGNFSALPGPDTSFNIKIPLVQLSDNEHSVTVYAEDIHGVRGPEVIRKFRVSLEEPKGSVIVPKIEDTVRLQTVISGTASDKNGIARVQISLDNGNSYNDATGTEQWSYAFDTRAIEDGAHVLFIKIVDNYGIQGLYSSLINIDNTKPDLSLDLPLDDSVTSGKLFFSGYTTDNVGLKKLYITIRSLDAAGKENVRTDLIPDAIVARAVDLNSLDNGFYNVELTGSDAAGNVARVSRNIRLDKDIPPAKVSILYPLNNEHKQGIFNIYGIATSEESISELTLYIDNVPAAATTVSDSGYFKFNLTPDVLSSGSHTYNVVAELADGVAIKSAEQTVVYVPQGPWVTVDNFTYGDFAVDRPYLRGRAGYVLNDEKSISSEGPGKSGIKEQRQISKEKTVKIIEISFDNGKTFIGISKKNDWNYRIENDDMTEGYHFLLVRATMKNGETAVTRTIVQIDKQKPSVRLISPGEGGHYNQSIEFSGLAEDTVGLKNVTLALRQGDKDSYEVPSFIQGLYLDSQFWGATLFNVGIGLTFFDDNVKLQIQAGQFTEQQRKLFTNSSMRYGGDAVLGMKILANVGTVPFRWLLGPDWEWLSGALAVGADFTRFNETNSEKAQILSALLAQAEFPRVSLKTLFPQLHYFGTVSLYTEFQLWFIPTDVTSTVDIQNIVPQISGGIRINVF